MSSTNVGVLCLALLAVVATWLQISPLSLIILPFSFMCPDATKSRNFFPFYVLFQVESFQTRIPWQNLVTSLC